MDSEGSNESENFRIAGAVICFPVTTNDYGERSVFLIQQMIQSGRFKNEGQLQYALQIAEQNQANVTSFKKSTQIQQLHVLFCVHQCRINKEISFARRMVFFHAKFEASAPHLK